jgi:hypothetical protein
MNAHLKIAYDAIDRATKGMTAEQLDWHPEGKWSAANILEHLDMAFSATIRGLSLCLDENKTRGTTPSLTQRLQQAVVLDVGYFPEGRKAPKMVDPTGTLGGLASVERIKADIHAMDAKIIEASSKFGAGCRVVDHPVLGAITMKQWPKFHKVHTLHHMKQIERLKAMMPKASAS